MVLPVPAREALVLVYAQGAGPSSGSLLEATLFVMESLSAT